ncbi:MAG: heavy metal-associated domain-containing protein [Acidobacteriota bacterium]
MVPSRAAWSQETVADDLLRIEIADLGACRGCAGSMERSLDKLAFVTDARLDPEDPVLVLRLAADLEIDELAVRDAVRNKGYTAGRIEVQLRGRISPDGREFRRPGTTRAWPLRWSPGIEVGGGEVLLGAVLISEGDESLLEVLRLPGAAASEDSSRP